MIFFLPMISVLGAILGSFSNVIIHRLPLGESIVTPRSHCPKCKKLVTWKDNIPIISYLVLRGKCRNCSQPIGIRYFLVEIIMAVLFATVTLTVGIKWTLLEYLILVFGLVTVSFIDLDHYILPDVFTLPGIIIGLIGAAINPEREFLSALIGFVLGGGFLWAIAYLYLVIRKQDGMGGGDIKLLAWIGAVLGWPSVPFVILSSSVVGSLAGVFMMRKSKQGLKTMLPYGPFLAFGAVLYLLGGFRLAYNYLILFFPWLEPFDI